MVEAAGAFDAWGSSLLGGGLGAVVALLVVYLAQRGSDRRKEGQDRRDAGARLVLSVSNLADYASSPRSGLAGDYSLFELRNNILLTYSALHGLASFEEVKALYSTIEDWRKWVRARQHPGQKVYWPPQAMPLLDAYQRALRAYADSVIKLLNEQLVAKPPRFERPTMPALPDVPER